MCESLKNKDISNSLYLQSLQIVNFREQSDDVKKI